MRYVNLISNFNFCCQIDLLDQRSCDKRVSQTSHWAHIYIGILRKRILNFYIKLRVKIFIKEHCLKKGRKQTNNQCHKNKKKKKYPKIFFSCNQIFHKSFFIHFCTIRLFKILSCREEFHRHCFYQEK